MRREQRVAQLNAIVRISAATMSDERQAPRLRPRCVAEELLVTNQAELSAGLVAAVAEVCGETPWVRVAYLCRVRREYDADGGVREALGTFVLPDPPLEERLTTPEQRIQFLKKLPDSMQEGGLSVRADAAVSEVEQLGVRVYEQTSPTGPPTSP